MKPQSGSNFFVAYLSIVCMCVPSSIWLHGDEDLRGWKEETPGLLETYYFYY